MSFKEQKSSPSDVNRKERELWQVKCELDGRNPRESEEQDVKTIKTNKKFFKPAGESTWLLNYLGANKEDKEI